MFGSAPSVFEQRPRLLLAIVIGLFVVACAIRLPRLGSSGMLIDREYTSAIFARAFYFRHRPDLPVWRREMAEKTLAKQPTLEPPVTEWLTSVLYRIAGREDLRLGRALALSFWLVGGLLFLLLARSLVGVDAAVVGLAYYLFLPLSEALSRSFQADALMMLLFLSGLLGIVRYHQAPSPGRLAMAALVGAAALVYRPLVLPALVLAFVLPAVQRDGWRRGLFGSATLVYAAVVTVPAFAYYGYGTFVARTFGWKLQSSFMLSLWAHREYWSNWLALAIGGLGAAPLVLAIAGFALLRRGLPRALVAGLALGYLAFGLAFTYHIHTHGYYQAQLIPAVALAGSPLVVLLVEQVLSTPARRVAVISLVLAAMLALMVWIDAVRRTPIRKPFESGPVAAAIGQAVRHSDRVVFISPFYGLPLQYRAELTGAYWPRSINYWLYRAKGERERSVEERLGALGFVPEYFLITDFAEYGQHHTDLRAYLESRCAKLARAGKWLLFGLCEGKAAVDPPHPVGSFEDRPDDRGGPRSAESTPR